MFHNAKKTTLLKMVFNVHNNVQKITYLNKMKYIIAQQRQIVISSKKKRSYKIIIFVQIVVVQNNIFKMVSIV